MGLMTKFKCRRHKAKFPKTLNAVRFAYQLIAKSEGKEQLPQYFDDNGKYINYKTGDIVPIERMGDYVGFYKITGYKSSPWSDNAQWDDSRKYNLVIHHVEFSPQASKKKT